MTPDLTDDVLARRCLELRNWIRRQFEEAQVVASVWTPRPCPPRKARNVRA
jgi:hypothetical protein